MKSAAHKKPMKSWNYISSYDQTNYAWIHNKLCTKLCYIALWMRRCRLYISARHNKYLKQHYWNLVCIQTPGETQLTCIYVIRYTQICQNCEMQYEIHAQYSKCTHFKRSVYSHDKVKSVRWKKWRWTGRNVIITLKSELMMAKTKKKMSKLLHWVTRWRFSQKNKCTVYAIFFPPPLLHCKKTMSRVIIKTGSTKPFLSIRNASFLRKTKLQRGLSILSRFRIRHCPRHLFACRRQQGASNMIRQSAARGSQGAKEQQ